MEEPAPTLRDLPVPCSNHTVTNVVDTDHGTLIQQAVIVMQAMSDLTVNTTVTMTQLAVVMVFVQVWEPVSVKATMLATTANTNATETQPAVAMVNVQLAEPVFVTPVSMGLTAQWSAAITECVRQTLVCVTTVILDGIASQNVTVMVHVTLTL